MVHKTGKYYNVYAKTDWEIYTTSLCYDDIENCINQV